MKMNNMKNKIGRCPVAKFLWLALFLMLSATVVFAAGNGNGYVKCAGAHGGTTFVYSDNVGGTKLAKTSLIQFVYAGADGIADIPDASGNPTDDDSLITPPGTGTVGTPWNTDGEFMYTLDNMTDNAKIYVRVWNASTINGATKYGDSVVYQINGGSPKPTPFTWNVPSFATTASKPVANQAPNVPGSPAQSIGNGAWVNSGNVNLTMSMSDPNNPDTLTPQVELTTGSFTNTHNNSGTAVAYTGQAVTGTVIINIANLAEGDYKWQARIKDAANANSSFVQYNGGSTSIRVDKSGPSAVSITAPTSPTKNTSLNFSWTAATDSKSGLAATPYYYLINTSANTDANTVKTTGTNIAQLGATVNAVQGTNYLHVVAVDAVGNIGTVAHSSAVVVDTTAPTISSTSPSTPASITANIVIAFSEAMNKSSVIVTPSPNPAGGLTLVGWTDGDKTVTYSHATAFNNSTEYTISISGQDLAENAISTSYKFTTVAPNAPSITSIWNNADSADITNVGEKALTAIRIKGTNFGVVEKAGNDFVWPKVTFNNNKPGTIWYAAPDNNAIEIQVQIPQGATTGNITVQSKAGTSGTKPFTILPPAQITGLSASAGDKQVSLSWTKPTDSGFTGTLIVRKATSAPSFTPVNGTAYTNGQDLGNSTVVVYNDSGSSTLDSNLNNNTKYCYAAFAHDGGPNYTTPAAQANATPQAIPNTITVSAPKGGEVYNSGDDIKVTWTYTGAIAKVDIDLSIDGGNVFAPVVPAIDNTGSYTLSKVSANADYTNCKIRVRDTADSNTYGISGAFTVKAPPPPTISKVYNKKEGASAKWVYVTEYDPNWNGTPEESLNLIVEGASLGENSTDYKKSDNNNAPAGSKIEVKAYNSDKFVEIKDADTPDRMYWWQKDKIEVGIHDKLGGSTVVAGAAKVKVTTLGGSSEESFAIKPWLSGISSPAKAGEVIKITGTAFGTNVDNIKVKFGSVETKPAKAENTTLEVTVPADAATGNVTVVVNGEESNSMAFALTDSPALSVDPAGLSFTAVEGGANPANQSLTIKNTGKGTLNWQISKGSTWLTVSPTSGATDAGNSDTITVSVNSAGLTAGEKNDSLAITSNGGDTAAQVTLKITSPSLDTPTVTSVSPSAAPAGVRISVAGDKFGSSEGQSRLVFENTVTNTTYAAEIKSWSNTAIEAIVPRLAAMGDYKLKVVRMSIAAGTGQMTALESNTSDFAITASGAADVVTMYPNPVNAGKESVTIAYNAGGVTNIGIYLFDMTAKLVYRTSTSAGQITWDGIDQSGFIVGDGVYIVRVVNEDTKGLIAKGKLLVVKK